MNDEQRRRIDALLNILALPEADLFAWESDGDTKSRFMTFQEPVHFFWDEVRELGLQTKHNWRQWAEGTRFQGSPALLSDASAEDCRKFIFALRRAERFGHGSWHAGFTDGTLDAALRRILALEDSLAHDRSWFESLFGFREADYAQTQARFAYDDGILTSHANGRTFEAGVFATPSLGELRAATMGLSSSGKGLVAQHEVIGDVLELHADPENRGALFQAASQLNCLEFPDSNVVPEDGITDYALDPTQGPACSLAAAAGTVVRNYFVPVAEQIGQTASNQINTLADVLNVLGVAKGLVEVKNGYSLSTEPKLRQLNEVLRQHDRDDLRSRLRIGVHREVGVTFSSRWREPDVPQLVSQAYCSALSCGYTSAGTEPWKPLATLVLEGAYEATLRAAALEAAMGRGSGRVWLTFLGGGVFGNEMAWIGEAIARALHECRALELDVRIAHYGRLNQEVVRLCPV